MKPLFENMYSFDLCNANKKYKSGKQNLKSHQRKNQQCFAKFEKWEPGPDF